MPRIVGSKNSLCVLLPVPDLIQSLLPSKTIAPFRVTPVFFNVGINEMATIAENLGNTKPQDSSNIDNFERLNEFCSRYRKLNLSNNSDCERQGTSVGELMSSLKDALYSNKSKNVEVLQKAAKICRCLKGMTYEFINILYSYMYHINCKEYGFPIYGKLFPILGVNQTHFHSHIPSNIFSWF